MLDFQQAFFEDVFDEMTLSGLLTLIYTICNQDLHDENLVKVLNFVYIHNRIHLWIWNILIAIITKLLDICEIHYSKNKNIKLIFGMYNTFGKPWFYCLKIIVIMKT